MPSHKDGIMVILSSPSGAGKTTLVNLLSKQDNFEISISHTTRQPRPGELANKDYYFVNLDEFKRLINNEEFLEYAKVFNHLYGTSRSPVISNLQKGKNVIFDIDWQGTRQIRNKKLNYKLITIFVLPPSKKELINRLVKREKKNLKTVKKRMKGFKRDLSKWREYDFVVINDDLKKCYSKIMFAIRNKILFDHNKIRMHVEKLLS